MFALNSLTARFASFATAADCAVKHAQQRGECQLRARNSGLLLADFRRMDDGTVSVVGVCEGKAMVEKWAA